MKAKRIVSAALALVMAAAVSAPALAAEPVPAGAHVGEYNVENEVKLTIASSAASSNTAYSVQVAAAEAVKEATGGKVQIDCVWDGTLGNDAELIENCIAGAIPMISLATSPLLPYFPQIGVFDCPAVFADDASARAGIAQFVDSFAPIFEEAGLKLLAMDFSQWRGLSSNVEIKTPDDFKNVKIRVMENQYHIAFWTNLGAQPTPLAFSELYTSLQQGLVNSQDNPLAGVVASKFTEVQDFWMPITAFPFVNVRLMNLDAFNALEADAQQAVIDFAQEDLEQEYWMQIDDNARLYEQIAAEGSMTVLEYTDEIKEALVAAGKPVWDQVAKSVGEDVVDAYLATGGQSR